MLKSLISNFINFDGKLIFFAINNICNCKCEMCSIWKDKNKKIVKFEEAKNALQKLYKNDFRFLQLTGGEPFLNPDFFKILNYSKKLGFVTFVPTNGTLINKNVAMKLARSKVDQISVSFHHFDPKIFEKISGHKNILNKVLSSIKYLKNEKVPTSALCTITKDNYRDIGRIVEYLDNLDINVSFCTPMIIKNTTYSLGGDSVKFNRRELKKIIFNIIKLKRKHKNIINNSAFLEDLVNFLDNKKSKYPCLGGNKIFYLDWSMNLYPCMCKGKPININQVNLKDTQYGKCDECIIQCFREPSLFLASRKQTISIVMKDLQSYINFLKNIYAI